MASDDPAFKSFFQRHKRPSADERPKRPPLPETHPAPDVDARRLTDAISKSHLDRLAAKYMAVDWEAVRAEGAKMEENLHAQVERQSTERQVAQMPIDTLVDVVVASKQNTMAIRRLETVVHNVEAMLLRAVEARDRELQFERLRAEKWERLAREFGATDG